MLMAILTCEQLSVRFETENILNDVNLAVQAGEYICIVGANGSGKTTLLRALAGLIHPTSGQIRYGEGLRRQEIGYLPQQTVIQKDFPANVREVVLSGCLNHRGIHPFYSREDKEKADQAMAQLEILPLKKRPYRDLSGGQQQRVLLARALCASRRLLLLDEPVTGLDPVAAGQLYELLDQLHTRAGMSVVMVSHDVDSALRYAQKIVHITSCGQAIVQEREAYRTSAAGRQFLSGEDLG